MKDQRINDMKEYILDKKSVSLKELCTVFDLSLNTVRRYINQIGLDTNIKKVYGGVSVQLPVSPQSTFSERNQSESRSKQLIAKKAAEFIAPNDIIYIDSGTTTMYILDYIPAHTPVTVITNSYHILRAALERPEITLISLPGVLDRRTLSFSSDNSRYLDSLNIHKAFMACTGISVNDGATNSFSSECTNKKIAIRKADQVFLLADSSKFGISTLMTYCPLEQVNCLVTNEMPDDKLSLAIRDRGNAIVLIEPSGTDEERI